MEANPTICVSSAKVWVQLHQTSPVLRVKQCSASVQELEPCLAANPIITCLVNAQPWLHNPKTKKKLKHRNKKKSGWRNGSITRPSTVLGTTCRMRLWACSSMTRLRLCSTPIATTLTTLSVDRQTVKMLAKSTLLLTTQPLCRRR